MLMYIKNISNKILKRKVGFNVSCDCWGQCVLCCMLFEKLIGQRTSGKKIFPHVLLRFAGRYYKLFVRHQMKIIISNC